MSKIKSAASLLFCILLSGCSLLISPPVTTGALLEEMTDMKAFSYFPDPPFTCRQFSSYDRKSKSPDEGWFANGDCGEYLCEEKTGDRTEYVMMDAAGPGAVVRIWSANPKGTLRVYVDGASTPVIEEKMTDLLAGKGEGIPFPIAHTTSRGWNSYYPIPYSKSCRITSDENGFYYQINYRTYPIGTKVVSFDGKTPGALSEQSRGLAEKLENTNFLSAPSSASLDDVLPEERPLDLTIPAGEREAIAFNRGNRAIFAIALNVDADNVEDALRGTVLRMFFDGIKTVDVPLGDFFGSAPGLAAYASLPMGITADGTLWCRWWMPHHRNAEIVFENHSGGEVTITGSIGTAPYDWRRDSMYFHAGWRIDKEVPTRPMIDWNYMNAKGRGVFMGDALYVSNPVKTWWGEGDEKIYVDDELFPSHFGTGTEDYYGYAWCSPELFSNAFHNQPRCDGPGNYGHTAVNRWHILDRIPFETSFRFDMEIWHWKNIKVDYAVTTYWYAFSGATDNFPPAAENPDDLVLSRVPAYVIFKVKGAIEGEKMEIVSKTGVVEPQTAGEKYSNETHLWWREARIGDELSLAFDCPKEGAYNIFVVLTKANDYGIHQLAVNGIKAGKPVDLYKSEQWGPTAEIHLGAFELDRGRNLLTVTVAGTNDEAQPNFMFGIDYLRITE